MKGESPDPRIPCGPFWLSPEKEIMNHLFGLLGGLHRLVFTIALNLILILSPGHASVVGFEDLTLAPGSFWNGYTGAGIFTSGGVTLPNSYNSTYGSWSGFAYSNVQDPNTPGWGNQYAARPGGGANGSSTYVVGYQTYGTPWEINLGGSRNFQGRGLQVANTTYAALDMRDGSGFSKKFGGAAGTDADWFRLTIEGRNSGVSTGAVEFYLADFRFTDSAQDYILNTWAFVDLNPLGTVDALRFALASSDNGAYGMNTPAYFAMDNLGVLPEPTSQFLLWAAALGLATAREIRRARRE
jgi:hypothetical protein